MTQNRYKHKSNLLPLIITASISICIPLGLYSFLKPKQSPEPMISNSYDPGYGQDILILEVLQNMPENIIKQLQSTSLSYNIQSNIETNELTVQWLDSPVMQNWLLNEKTRIWETALPYKDSFRSTPTLIFGLREDGVVVWKRKNKEHK